MTTPILLLGRRDPKVARFLASPVLLQVPDEFTRAANVKLTDPPLETWLSRAFMAQIYAPRLGGQRLSVNRPHQKPAGGWVDGITWDELMQVKREIGRGDCWALEPYPAERDLVCRCNIRHLWLISEAPDWAWRYGVDPSPKGGA